MEVVVRGDLLDLLRYAGQFVLDLGVSVVVTCSYTTVGVPLCWLLRDTTGSVLTRAGKVTCLKLKILKTSNQLCSGESLLTLPSL